MSIITEPSPYLREMEARKLFGFALKNDPDTLYDQIDRPEPNKLPLVANRFITADYANTRGKESEAPDLLLNGLVDTQIFILNIMHLHPDIPYERAVAIAQQKRTIEALAIIARQSSNRSYTLINNPGDSYDLDPHEGIVRVDDSVRPSVSFGCPAVEIINDHDVKPWPIFGQFGHWATKLALISYFDHK